MHLIGDLSNTLDRSLVNDNAIQDFQKYFKVFCKLLIGFCRYIYIYICIYFLNNCQRQKKVDENCFRFKFV